jgi:hypothetical protein
MRLKGYWSLVYVTRGTPLVCSVEQLESSRSHTTKNGYSFDRERECEEHAYTGFDYECDDCKEVTTSYTDDDLLQSAIQSASQYCDRTRDTWVVDSDTREIVAAFHMIIERLV